MHVSFIQMCVWISIWQERKKKNICIIYIGCEKKGYFCSFSDGQPHKVMHVQCVHVSYIQMFVFGKRERKDIVYRKDRERKKKKKSK